MFLFMIVYVLLVACLAIALAIAIVGFYCPHMHNCVFAIILSTRLPFSILNLHQDLDPEA